MTFVGEDGGVWQELPPPDWDQLAAGLEAARAELAAADPVEAARRYCLARYSQPMAVAAEWQDGAGSRPGGRR